MFEKITKMFDKNKKKPYLAATLEKEAKTLLKKGHTEESIIKAVTAMAFLIQQYYTGIAEFNKKCLDYMDKIPEIKERIENCKEYDPDSDEFLLAINTLSMNSQEIDNLIINYSRANTVLNSSNIYSYMESFKEMFSKKGIDFTFKTIEDNLFNKDVVIPVIDEGEWLSWDYKYNEETEKIEETPIFYKDYRCTRKNDYKNGHRLIYRPRYSNRTFYEKFFDGVNQHNYFIYPDYVHIHEVVLMYPAFKIVAENLKNENYTGLFEMPDIINDLGVIYRPDRQLDIDIYGDHKSPYITYHDIEDDEILKEEGTTDYIIYDLVNDERYKIDYQGYDKLYEEKYGEKANVENASRINNEIIGKYIDKK